MDEAVVIASEVLREIERQAPCTLDELIRALPAYSWNQVFLAVDDLTRRNVLMIHRGARSDYLITLAGQSLLRCGGPG